MNRALCWLRRDLRLTDHRPLAEATRSGTQVAVAFVFDTQILNQLADRDDRRLSFIHRSLEELDQGLRAHGSRLIVLHGDPIQEIPKLAKALQATTVYAGRDFESYALRRDREVASALSRQGAQLRLLKDQVVFEGSEILKENGEPYRVFTPYQAAWLHALQSRNALEEATPNLVSLCPAHDLKECGLASWDLLQLGFQPSDLWLEPGEQAAEQRLEQFFDTSMEEYQTGRDAYAEEGTSGLSVHLRFGTLSIRQAARTALRRPDPGARKWLSELIWREFYQAILFHAPFVETGAFLRRYDAIEWPGLERHFEAWCAGETGYPVVDAAMRHFNQTGWMHNRLRMIVASFLCKDLLIDWRKGEAYFARYLLDYDLASNNGGWQWCASTGVDPQPVFRIFNPLLQSKKFDPQGAFLRRHLPELAYLEAPFIHFPATAPTHVLERAGGIVLGRDYPAPIVDHGVQRGRALALYKTVSPAS